MMVMDSVMMAVSLVLTVKSVEVLILVMLSDNIGRSGSMSA